MIVFVQTLIFFMFFKLAEMNPLRCSMAI